MSTSTMKCFSDSDMDTYNCDQCSAGVPQTRQTGKHDMFPNFENSEVFQLYIRHSKQLAKQRQQTFPTRTYSKSMDSPVETNCPVFSMKDIWADDDAFEEFNPLDSPRLSARRNAVWCLNNCSVEERNVACQNNSCSSLVRTKKVYNNLAAMA